MPNNVIFLIHPVYIIIQGPATLIDNGKSLLIGVASYCMDMIGLACNSSMPVMYSSVYYHHRWIKKTIGK